MAHFDIGFPTEHGKTHIDSEGNRTICWARYEENVRLGALILNCTDDFPKNPLLSTPFEVMYDDLKDKLDGKNVVDIEKTIQLWEYTHKVSRQDFRRFIDFMLMFVQISGLESGITEIINEKETERFDPRNN